MRTLASIVTVVFTFLTLVPSVQAQTSHAAPQSALDAALQQHVASEAEDRALVQHLLDRPEVRALAGHLGLDVLDAKHAVAALSGLELRELAAQAQQVDEALSGGQSRITISTTLLIIGLLVLILIIVAVK